MNNSRPVGTSTVKAQALDQTDAGRDEALAVPDSVEARDATCRVAGDLDSVPVYTDEYILAPEPPEQGTFNIGPACRERTRSFVAGGLAIEIEQMSNKYSNPRNLDGWGFLRREHTKRSGRSNVNLVQAELLRNPCLSIQWRRRSAKHDQVVGIHQIAQIGVKDSASPTVSFNARGPDWTQQCAAKGSPMTPKTTRACRPLLARKRTSDSESGRQREAIGT